MKIIFISHLSGSIAAGLSWSVPARVLAQSKIDDVLWVDSSTKSLPHWNEIESYHQLAEYGSLNLKYLPAAFQKPDCVVFEGFYCKEEVTFSKELNRNNIPYIIVPRGSLTYQARHNHGFLKKQIAHWLWFDSYVKRALAVQYLTKAEQYDSRNQPSRQSFVLSNGFNQPKKSKTVFSKKGLKAVFIGRLDIYHKGLDLLVGAIVKEQRLLRARNFTLGIYGPEKQDYAKLKELFVKYKIDDIVTLKGEISGEYKEKVLLESDLFVLTSRFEGHPMGLVEALAYGLPVLVTPGSNMSEEITNENAGWVADGTSESIAFQLRDIVSNQFEISEKGANARLLSKRYSWDKLAKEFHDKISELLKKNSL